MTPRPALESRSRLPVPRSLWVAWLVGPALVWGPGCSSRQGQAPRTSTAPATAPKVRSAGLQAALDLYDAGRYGEAATTLAGLLAASDGGGPEAYSLLGLTHLQQKDFASAEKVLREGRARHPKDGSVAEALGRMYLMRAKEAFERDDRPAAKQAMAQAIAEAPPAAGLGSEARRAYQEAAVARLRAGQAQGALDLVGDALGLGLTSPEIQLVGAAGLHGLGKVAEARAAAATLDPGSFADPELAALLSELRGASTRGRRRTADWGRSAEELVAAGRLQEGLAAYRRALETPAGRGPGRAGLLRGAFGVALELRSFESAREYLEARRLLAPQDLEVELDEARLLGQSEGGETARRFLEELATRRGEDPRVQLALAAQRVTDGEDAAAQTALDRLLGTPGLASEVEADAYELLGILAAKRQDLDGAEEWWKRLVTLEPGHAKAYFNLGFLNQKRGRWREAVEYLERAVEASGPRDPEHAKYLYWLGLGHRQNGTTKELCRTFEKLLVVAPADDPYRKQGEVILERECGRDQGRPAALPEDPSHPLNQAFDRLASGDERGAEEALGRALAQASSKAEQRLARTGWARLEARRARPAWRAFHLEEALAIEATPEVQLELAQAYFELGAYARSLATWEKLGRAAPDQARRRYEIARCLDRLGRAGDAMEAYEEAISLDPEGTQVAGARARLDELVSDGMQGEAASGSAEAAPVDGLLALAEVYRHEGRADRAASILEEATRQGSGSAAAWVGVGNHRRAAGDATGARQAFEKALEIDPGSAAASLAMARLELEDPSRLQAGFELLSRARAAGGRDGSEATLELVRLYRSVGQEADARVLLGEVIRSAGEPDLVQKAKELMDPPAVLGTSAPGAGSDPGRGI